MKLTRERWRKLAKQLRARRRELHELTINNVELASCRRRTRREELGHQGRTREGKSMEQGENGIWQQRDYATKHRR